MKVNQREIVEVAFPLPNGRFLRHPAIVLSVREKRSFVKWHLIEKFRESEVMAKFGSLKPFYFKELLSYINDIVMGNECK